MSRYYENSGAIIDVVEAFATAPWEHPDIIPTILPIVVGALVITLYFGKHKDEELGWNTAVGNAVMWTTTGVTLYMTETLSTPELYATMGLIGLGLLVGYMDFFHKWSSTAAFVISSSGIVYTLAYILVVMVKTDLPLTDSTFQGAAVFFIAVNVGFKILQGFETDQRQMGYGTRI